MSPVAVTREFNRGILPSAIFRKKPCLRVVKNHVIINQCIRAVASFVDGLFQPLYELRTDMGCTNAGHKTFLVVCNIGLLFTGLSILVLGVKMKSTLSLLMLDQVAMLVRVSKAIIATGAIITLTGGSGFAGACYEVLWLICIHLGGLGVIVVMEFGVGVTLLMVKNMVENLMETSQCGQFCSVTLKSVIMELAMPSAGLMMTVIVMEALMIYSAVKLFFHFRDRPKDEASRRSPSVVVQDMRMRSVSVNRNHRMSPPNVYVANSYLPRQPLSYVHYAPQPSYEEELASHPPPPPYEDVVSSATAQATRIKAGNSYVSYPT